MFTVGAGMAAGLFKINKVDMATQVVGLAISRAVTVYDPGNTFINTLLV